MSEEIASFNVNIDADAAITALNKLNSALDKLDNAGQVQVRRLQAIDSVIDDLAASYGENADKAKVLFRQMSANVGTTSEYKDTVSELAKAQAFLTRSMSQGATFEKATINLRKKQITDANKLNKALAEQAATTNKTSKSRKKSAEVVETEAEKYDRLLAVADAANKYAERLSNNRKKGQLDTNSVGFETQIKQQEKLAEAEQKAIQKAVDAYEEAEKQKKAIADRALVDANNKKHGVAEPKTKEQIKSYKDMYTELIAEKTKTDNILNSKMKQFTADAISYDKKQEKSANTKADNIRAAEEKMFDEISKNNMDRLAASEKAAKTEADTTRTVLNEKIKLMREYMSFQNQIDNGQIDKKKANSINPDKMSRISQGKDIFDQAQADPAKFEELARAAASWRANLDSVNASQARFVDSAKKAEEGVKSFTLSWQTMGRILVAQAFSQVFFGMQNAISAAVKEAEELYKAVAEIQTITERASQGALAYATALQSVIATSSKINFTPQDTANAFYETLSNQIGENVTQINSFIESAGQLGKVTRATLADSTDAISSVMNAYNMSVGEAANISAKLFTLVDQGRLKLAEVANSMGNVTVPAAQLGVDFDNVVAGLSAISIAGVAPRESMTLFRNIMFKLIDPTEAMTKLFGEWGVSSGQAAIATFGFEGVLARLNVEARKGNAEIAELLGTIRAVRGVLGLTDENFEKYAKALDASRKSQENYNAIVQDYVNNPGEKFRKLLQQTSNEFLQIGISIVGLVSKFADLAGTTADGTFRLAEMAGVVAKLAFTVGLASAAFFLTATAGSAFTVALAAMSGTAVAATGAVGLLTTAMTALSLTPPVLAFTAFVTVLATATAATIAFSKTTKQANAEIAVAAQNANKDVGKAYTDGIIAAYKTISDEYDSRLRKTLEKTAEKIQALNAKIREIEGEKAIEKVIDRFKRLEEAVAGSESQQRLLMVVGEAAENYEAFGNVIGETNKSLEESSSYWQKQADDIQNVIDKLKQQRDAVLDLAASNRLNLEVSITERNFSGLAGRAKAEAQYRAAQDAASRAMNVADPEEAKKLFDIARKFLSDSEATAFESGALGNLQNHINYFNQQESALNAAQERRLAGELDLIDQEGQRQTLLGKEAKQNQERADEELLYRKEVQTTYEVQRTFLEYYDKKLKEIALNRNISNEEAMRQVDALNAKMNEGIANGLIPYGSAMADALNARSATNPLRAQTAQLAQGEQGLITQNSDIKNAQAGRNQVAETVGAKLSEAATKLEEATNILLEAEYKKSRDAQIGLVSGGMVSGSAPTLLKKIYESFQGAQKFKEILDQFYAAKAELDGKGANATPSDVVTFQNKIDALITKFEALSKTAGTEDSKSAILNAQAALGAARDGSTVLGEADAGLVKARAEAEVSLQRLSDLATPVDGLKVAVEDNTKAIDKAMDLITTYGIGVPQAEFDAAQQKIKALTPADLYVQRQNAQGNVGSSEGEFDTSKGNGESGLNSSVQEFIDQIKKDKPYSEMDGLALALSKAIGIADPNKTQEMMNKEMFGPVLTAKTFEEGLGRLFDNVSTSVGPAIAEVFIAKLMPALANWRLAGGASPPAAVITSLLNAQTAGGDMVPGYRDPNTKMAVDPYAAASTLAEQEQKAQQAYLDKQSEIAVVQQQAAQVQVQAAQTQAATASAGPQQAQAEAQTFVNYIDEVVRQAQAQAQAKTPMINGMPANMYPGQNIAPNTINGQPIAADRKNFGMINGEQLAPTVGDAVSTAAWSSVPNAIAQGAQSIPQAMAQGSNAISQAVVDGMAYAFRQQQQAESQGVHYAQPERRFAKGGPVGTDTIPAWLSRGEFVVNAQATKRNFNWLQAINSPSAQRFSKGGPVTNSQSFTNTFNLHTKNPNMQANQIVNAVRRQVAQGKATLTKGRPY